MIGSAFKKLAAENGLTVESGMAYGLLQGCYVTLTEGAGYKRMSIYVGGQVAAADGSVDMESPTVQNARNIAGMIAAASGDDNIYRLMTKHKNISALVVNHGGSVVTVNFFDNPGTMECISRFIAEMLPRIAPLCQPRQCLCCCGDVTGAGFPVRIASDTVVPMHGVCMDGVSVQDSAEEKSAGVSLGFLGAFAGAMLGALVWGFVYYNGYMASLVGLLIGFLASLGYDLLKGRPGVAKVIAVIVCTILAVLAGTAGSILWSLHVYYQELGSVVHRMMPEFTYFRTMLAELLRDSEFVSGMVKDVLLGLLFAGLGVIDVLRKNISGSADAGKPKQMSGAL